MSYNYQKERPWVFTDEGQRKVIEVLRKAQTLSKPAGVVQCDRILGSGDGWQSMAAIDRLVELGQLCEVPTEGAGQHRIFRFIEES